MKKLFLILALVALVATPVMANFTDLGSVGGTFYWQLDGTNTFVERTTNDQANVHNPTLGDKAGWLADLSLDAGANWDYNVYRTFCLESDIGFNPGKTYWATLDTKAFSGGQGGGVNGDAISEVTKYIADNHADLSLAYSYEDMRDAIWYAEYELSGVKNGLFDDLTDGTIANLDRDKDTADVLVINLWKDFDKHIVTANDTINGSAQIGDVIWIAQDVQSHVAVPVPAPGAILLGSLGMGLVGWLRRRNSL